MAAKITLFFVVRSRDQLSRQRLNVMGQLKSYMNPLLNEVGYSI
jgi:hypothetical protein